MIEIYDLKPLTSFQRKIRTKIFKRIFKYPLRYDKFKAKADKARFKITRFIYYFISDRALKKCRYNTFGKFGLKLFCGKQGSGKTVSMIHYLDEIKKSNPKCKIVTNFNFTNADDRLSSIDDLMKMRNGEDGIVFAIDEIQTLFPSSRSKDNFPFELLSTICQQRKQRVHIVGTSQVFSRTCKELREQTFTVFDCKTYASRWTVVKEYDAVDFEAAQSVITDQRRKKFIRIAKWSFVQTDALRNEYDTFEVINNEKLKD